MKKNNILNILKIILSHMKNVYVVGSIARGKEKPNDIDLVSTEKLKKLAEYFEFFFSDNIIFNIVGNKRLNLTIDDINVDVWYAEEDEKDEMLVMRTIDKGHAIAYRKKAKQMGYKLNDYGLFDGDEKIHFSTEQELRNLLNIKNN